MPQTTTTAEQQVAVEILNAWRTDPSIRAEFGTLARYASYREAVAAGKVKFTSKENQHGHV